MTAEMAKTTLEKEGFVMAAVDAVSDEVEIGKVIGYADYEPGEALAFGSVVAVRVSAEESAESGAE